MQSLAWYWRRIQCMDGPEVAWRISSLLRDQIDAVRIPLGRVPKLNADQLISKEDFEPGFRCSPVTHDNWREPLSDIQRRWRDRLLAKADDILNNRLSYFDLEAVHHGEPFNWHRDHSAGIDAPMRLSVHTDYRDFETYGDCKLVWEPNRHHQLVVLARAYVATGDRNYAEKVAELLRSWIDASPFGYGMNWKSPLELGVRLINWVWAIDLVRSADVFDSKLWPEILQNVYLAMWDCDRKYSRGSSANNHVIGEAAGVYIAASYFHQLPKTPRWRRAAKDVLEREIIAQTYSDGCTKEHAFGYQFFVIQFFLLSMRAGGATGDKFSDEFRARLLEMYRFMDDISADTGRPPNMGDSDDGYVLDLGEQPRNAAELISVGAYEYEQPQLVSATNSETVFWMYGISEQLMPTDTIKRTSRLFSESGYAILRSGRLSVFFDCAELGYGRIAAHGHADCLSFCLSIDGIPVLVDPGTYDYFSFPEWREYFRSTRAHNTVEIDDTSQSTSLGPFMWGRKPRPSRTRWVDNRDVSEVSAQHDGYRSLTDPVEHHRTISLSTRQNRLQIRDKFSCSGDHHAVIRFHCAPNMSVMRRSPSEVILKAQTFSCVVASAHSLEFTHGCGISLVNEWTSDGYHRRVQSNSLRITFALPAHNQHTTTVTLLD